MGLIFMTKTEYITVKELAKRAGITPQAVYKELNRAGSRLATYLKTIDNQKMLNMRALSEVYGVGSEPRGTAGNQPVEQLDNQPDNQPDSPKTLNTRVLSGVNGAGGESEGTTENKQGEQPVEQKDEASVEIIALLRSELEEKNRQIEQLHELLSQEQRLNAVSQQKILMLEARNGEPAAKEPETAGTEEAESPKRKGWLGRIFG